MWPIPSLIAASSVLFSGNNLFFTYWDILYVWSYYTDITRSIPWHECWSTAKKNIEILPSTWRIMWDRINHIQLVIVLFLKKLYRAYFLRSFPAAFLWKKPWTEGSCSVGGHCCCNVQKSPVWEWRQRQPTQVCLLLIHTNIIYYIAVCKYAKNVYFIYTNSCYYCGKKYFGKQLNLWTLALQTIVTLLRFTVSAWL